jgi:hypothetical protein
VYELVHQVFTLQHTKKQLLLLRLIVKLVANRVVEIRFAVEFMLNGLVYTDEALNHNIVLAAQNQNNVFNSAATQTELQKSLNMVSKPATSPYIWYKVLECIRKCIPMHDYKACRDIFKMLLELVRRIPHPSSSYPPPLVSEQPLVEEVSAAFKALHGLNSSSSRITNQQSSNKQQSRVSSQNKANADADIKLESLYEVSQSVGNKWKNKKKSVKPK